MEGLADPRKHPDLTARLAGSNHSGGLPVILLNLQSNNITFSNLGCDLQKISGKFLS